MENRELNATQENNVDVVNAIDFQPESTSNQIVRHQNYFLSYAEHYEQADWLMYTLKKKSNRHKF